MKSLKKIGGLFRSKGKEETKQTATAEETETEKAPEMSTAQDVAPAAAQSAQATNARCKIYVVFYSMYGHVHQLAQAIKNGIDSVQGCSATLYQVAETLPQDVLDKMHAPPKPDIPVLPPEDVAAADAIVFGFPTRFGMMCSQMKAFFDATGGLWKAGALAGKPASLFTATGTQGGGQETTVMTAVTQLVHHGMIFVPPGYALGNPLFNVEEVRGGSPWGAGTFAAADGSHQPSATEIAFAQLQGSYFAGKAKLLTNVA